MALGEDAAWTPISCDRRMRPARLGRPFDASAANTHGKNGKVRRSLGVGRVRPPQGNRWKQAV
jgi:hypothetical protein